jgi:ubiquinone/menaquinone biosynthesis C-methylase UbiE
MDFKEAYETIVARSVQKNTVEIPTILSCLDFEGAECLEVGAGPLGRIALKLAGFAKHITCLEKDADNVSKILGEAGYHNLDKKVSALYYKFEKEKFPFSEKKFDVVYSAWLPHKTATDTKFLDEMMRVSRKHVLILMPGIKGDEPKLVSLVRKGEKERRLKYREQITKYLNSKGFKVREDYKDTIIHLVFANEKEIQEVFHCLSFKNESLPVKIKQKVDKFLANRVKSYKDGFYIIHGIKL